MSKYKAGDKARVVAEHTSHCFPIGTIITLLGAGHNPRWEAKTFDGKAYGGSNIWYVAEDEIEPVNSENRKIVITSDGDTTLARLYDGNKVVERAEAKCAPGDAYDFDTGAKIAFDRLTGRAVETQIKPTTPAQEPIKLYCVQDSRGWCIFEKGQVYECKNTRIYDRAGHQSSYTLDWFKQHFVPLVKRPAKVGEWVYIVNAHCTMDNYDNGSLLQIVQIRSSDGKPRYRPECGCYLDSDEYLVLDGYQPEPEQPKYWSGKVVCTDAGRAVWGVTVGKIYTVKDGMMKLNDGGLAPAYTTPFISLDDMNEKTAAYSGAKFIEFRGEA